MLSLTAFSQKDTIVNIPSKTFTLPVVKLIIKDLLSGDSAKAQLKLTEEILFQTEKKVVLKDSIIKKMSEKLEISNNMIVEKDSQIEILGDRVTIVSKELKKEKFKNKLTKFVTGSVTAILAVLLIIK